jgi:putative tricarboxylic transport membrane protein
MLLGGVILVFKGIRQLPETGWLILDPWAKTVRSYLTLGLIFAALLFYILFSDKLGFIITCVLILFPLLLWTRGHKRILSSLIIAVSFSLLIYLVFVKFMRVPLPSGLLIGVY